MSIDDSTTIDARKAKQKVYREANKERIAARKKERYPEIQHVVLARSKAHYEANKEAINARKKVFRRENKVAISLRRKELVHGITTEDIARMEEAQGWRCPICLTPLALLPSRLWVIDHCHSTGRVRGILCNVCNRGLGFLKDDPRVLRRAAKYLSDAAKR
jgi:hypothetical protein